MIERTKRKKDESFAIRNQGDPPHVYRSRRRHFYRLCSPLFSSATLAERASVFARDEFGVVEAGILLNVHPDTIRALVKSGKLPARRAGGNGKILISAKALDQFAARAL
jgi:excisionase family DNA binding protein